MNENKTDTNQGCSQCNGCGCGNKKTALYEEQFDSLTIYFDQKLTLLEWNEKCQQLLILCCDQLKYIEGCFLSPEGFVDLIYENDNIEFIPSNKTSAFLYVEGSNLDAEAISELFSEEYEVGSDQKS